MRRALRRVAAVAAAFALIVPLAACSNGGDDDAVEIDFFHRWPNEPKNTYFAKLVKEFEAENPGIRVNVESVLNDAYKDKVKVVAGSAKAPDVMFSWSGTFLQELVEGGNVMKLDGWLKENAEVRESFYPSQLEAFAVDGSQYGLPLGMHAKLFFYNKDVFNELKLQPPTTWEEFVDVLEAIKASGRTPIEFGAQEQWPIAHYIGTLNQRILDPKVFAGDQVASNGTFDDPGYVTSLRTLLDVSKYMNPDMTAVGHEMARKAWIDGEAPIMYLQGAEVGYLKDLDFEYGTFNFPSVDGGKGDPAQLTGAPEGFVVAANSDHPQESLRFLKFMLSKQNGIAYTEKTGELSAVVGAVEESKAPAVLKGMTKEIVDASAMTPWLDNAYDPQIVKAYLSETQLMLGGQQTPEGVMDAVRAAAERVRSGS
ncbi:ABC transporter substrate-binding protein [Micromonospora sp. NPDC048830]|uniref:ABC transporter substrate-binding protein n=1 Tax=Micromonospora sp. NPDC048830 TaxID=3364257 RepID=UPI00371BE163